METHAFKHPSLRDEGGADQTRAERDGNPGKACAAIIEPTGADQTRAERDGNCLFVCAMRFLRVNGADWSSQDFVETA